MHNGTLVYVPPDVGMRYILSAFLSCLCGIIPQVFLQRNISDKIFFAHFCALVQGLKVPLEFFFQRVIFGDTLTNLPSFPDPVTGLTVTPYPTQACNSKQILCQKDYFPPSWDNFHIYQVLNTIYEPRNNYNNQQLKQEHLGNFLM